MAAPRLKRSDPRLLAQFFHADEQVTRAVTEMSCLDADLDPQRYLVLLSQLHLSQVRLLTVLQRIMDECIPTARHSRDYRAKFPEELLADDLGNHLLFAAECLVAGTFLELDVAEGQQLRPLARTLLCSLELVRVLLREQSLSQAGPYPESVQAALVRFDALFAEFELSYVSSLVTVKSPEELYKQQEIVVLFCETVQRALRLGYLTQEMIDQYEPLLMFTIPRLAIISGLLIYPEGPLSLERQPEEMSRVFSPFYVLLRKIRDLLRALSAEELSLLERSLDRGPGACSRPLGSKHLCVPPGTVQHARRAELRSRYSSTWDMIHTLFVCISGVADQLQTNFASDLRSILRTVFTIVMSQPEAPATDKEGDACLAETGPRIPNCALCSTSHEGTGTTGLPRWMPDSSCSQCSACHAPFTLLRRRHHCRNCGKIFCARCSPHTAPLPHYGQPKPLRRCLEQLRQQVPGGAERSRHTTLSLLHRARLHIQKLEEQERRAQRLKDRLQHEQRSLRRRLEQLVPGPGGERTRASSLDSSALSSERSDSDQEDAEIDVEMTVFDSSEGDMLARFCAGREHSYSSTHRLWL
ncbi:lateral signaling target 2-like protein [Alligator mississippiensis]|uniref:Lateral signaling target 2-like protein n=1 Tax=Alligator mississippiensis TaxID=8496 RepID=A0A151PG02_ALLMI|nr:lateral signaling target 2-like protein [Alligator mississippiensis]